MRSQTGRPGRARERHRTGESQPNSIQNPHARSGKHPFRAIIGRQTRLDDFFSPNSPRHPPYRPLSSPHIFNPPISRPASPLPASHSATNPGNLHKFKYIPTIRISSYNATAYSADRTDSAGTRRRIRTVANIEALASFSEVVFTQEAKT